MLIGDVSMSVGLAGPLRGPISGARKQRLDSFFGERLTDTSLLGAAVFRLDGRRVYAVGSVSRLREPVQQLRTTLRNGTVSTSREKPNISHNCWLQSTMKRLRETHNPTGASSNARR